MIDTLPAPLAAALTARGYTTLTPVQQAVLAPEAAGRDLLVSAQTGSGKTVAFGLAVAPELLAPPPASDAPAAPRALPCALVVAPTRELALQVRREFEWLFAGAGLEVASCVGGMEWRTERRALERGPAIVVGTPGRLRDHIERGSLNLGALRAAVLDEADEMLDLGFEEDLQFILAAAPRERRTLMFSATVPRGIEALAAAYQREALRIVARGEARQHVDIAYRALSVGARDKENAVLNLLRLMEPRAAIVFAKTRAGVAHLAARMGNRGLAVVALSGELSQGERSHALQALRDGRARVCIATDVAARGIDLPGLELVVHFDLPGSPETLLHRSGRTGRAGAKGQAVLVVAPSDRRKAERLLAGARVTAEWGRAPTADEVQAADDERLMAHPALAEPAAEDERAMVARLASFGDEALAAAVLRLWRAGRAAPEELHEPPPAAAASAPVRERTEFGPSVWYALSAGHDRRVEARWLLPKLCEAGGITRLSVGAIRVQAERSFLQVAEAAAGRLEAALGAGLALEEGLVLTRLAGEPDLAARPARAAPPHRDRPLPRAFDRPQGPARAPRPGRSDVPGRTAPRDAGADRPPPGAEDLPPPRRAVADRPARPPAPRRDAPGADEAAPRRPYARRDAPGADEPAPRRPYARRDAPGADEAAPRRPYTRRDAPGADEAAPRRPYARRDAPGADEPAPRKPYARRDAPGADEAAPRKPYARRDEPSADEAAPRRPYTRRDAPGADEAAPRKPYARRDAPGADEAAPRKPRPVRAGAVASGPKPRPRKPGPVPFAGGDAPRKPRWTRDDPRRDESRRGEAPGEGAKAPSDLADPSQSLRRRPPAKGGSPGPRFGKPGPRKG